MERIEKRILFEVVRCPKCNSATFTVMKKKWILYRPNEEAPDSKEPCVTFLECTCVNCGHQMSYTLEL